MATQRPVHIDATSGNVRELVAGDKLGGVTNGTATGEALTFDAIGVSVQAYSASTTLLGNTVTGTGSIVLATSPTLVTPVLGVATATSLACPTLTSAAAMTLTPASTNDCIVATSGATASLRISGAAATATTALTLYNAAASLDNRNWAIAQNQGVYADLHIMQSNAQNGNPLSAGTTALCINPNRNVGIGTTSPSARVHAVSTTEQLRLGYDSSNYLSTTVSSGGAVTFDSVGASAGFVFSDNVGIGVTPIAKLHLGLTTSTPGNLALSTVDFVGMEYSGGSLILGYNCKAFESTTEKVVVASTNATIGYDFIRLGYNNGIEFHALLGSVTAAATASSPRMVIKTDGNVIIGHTGTALGKLESRATSGAQLVASYDSSNYLSTTVSSAGLATLATTGTNASITLTPSGTGNVIMSKIPRFNGTNSTGAGSSLLGANSPATTLTAPYTWISVITSDGSTAYIPCWK